MRSVTGRILRSSNHSPSPSILHLPRIPNPHAPEHPPLRPVPRNPVRIVPTVLPELIDVLLFDVGKKLDGLDERDDADCFPYPKPTVAQERDDEPESRDNNKE